MEEFDLSLAKIIYALVCTFALFMLKELYKAFKDNTTAIASLNVSLIELKSTVALLTYQITPVAKIKEDLNALHTKVRVVETKLQGKSSDKS